MLFILKHNYTSIMGSMKSIIGKNYENIPKAFWLLFEHIWLRPIHRWTNIISQLYNAWYDDLLSNHVLHVIMMLVWRWLFISQLISLLNFTAHSINNYFDPQIPSIYNLRATVFQKFPWDMSYRNPSMSMLHMLITLCTTGHTIKRIHFNLSYKTRLLHLSQGAWVAIFLDNLASLPYALLLEGACHFVPSLSHYWIC